MERDTAPEQQDTEPISPGAAREALAANEAHAIDIRDDEGWRSGHIPGAHHIPAEEIEERSGDFPTEERVIVADEQGEHSEEAAAALREAGHDAVSLEGGMDAWRSADLPMQPSPDVEEGTPI